MQVDSRSVHVFIIWKHGDSEFSVWSSTNISGVPLKRFCEAIVRDDKTKLKESAEILHKVINEVS